MLEIVKKDLIKKLNQKRLDIVPDAPPEYINIIADSVNASLNIISLSDAMYHDVDHTCLVTLCGQEILYGKKIKEGNVDGLDWLHFTISLLFHDIGYVKNILLADSETNQIINKKNDSISLISNQPDASLTPYHIERGKMFIDQRIWPDCIDKNILMDLISYTQFPQPERHLPIKENKENFESLAILVGSADLIGQLADPMYDEKIPRLFYELKESGSAEKMGYAKPQDLREGYPGFFLNFVRPNIEEALAYLKISEEGRTWVSGLNYHVFSQSHKATIEKSGVKLLTNLADLDLGSMPKEKFLKLILEAVSNYSKWPIAHAYEVDKVDGEVKLKSTKVWHTTISGNNFQEFVEVSEDYKFKIGEGLPGRVYKVGSVQTIFDVTKDSNFPRANLAKNIDVRGAFAVPIKNENDILYVLEFFSFNPEQISPPFIDLMKQISAQISRKFK